MGTFHLAAGQGIQQPSGRFDNHMDLDLAQVRAFVSVADEGHFGRAAELLSVSQQGLSKRIARLEAELGVRLLTRARGQQQSRGVTLTDAGQRFLPPARRLVAAGDIAAAVAVGEERPFRLRAGAALARVPAGRRLAAYGSSGAGSSSSQAGTFSSAWESMIASQVSSSTGSAEVRLLVTGTTIRSDS
ncbi:MAG TPA: LysR family transcriptional regulator [Streptosporangiaceae bacterium]|nr:LysR family transcriptional regulator [Streptosporangiaceae bacterium]